MRPGSAKAACLKVSVRGERSRGFSVFVSGLIPRSGSSSSSASPPESQKLKRLLVGDPKLKLRRALGCCSTVLAAYSLVAGSSCLSSGLARSCRNRSVASTTWCGRCSESWSLGEKSSVGFRIGGGSDSSGGRLTIDLGFFLRVGIFASSVCVGGAIILFAPHSVYARLGA